MAQAPCCWRLFRTDRLGGRGCWVCHDNDTYAVACAAFYGLLFLIERDRPATLLVAVPLFLGIVLAGYVYGGITDNSYNPMIAMDEKRVSAELVCRAYPKWYDSISGTQLLLLREKGLWKDEVVEAIDNPNTGRCFRVRRSLAAMFE